MPNDFIIFAKNHVLLAAKGLSDLMQIDRLSGDSYNTNSPIARESLYPRRIAMTRVSVSEAQKNLPELILAIERGEQIVITQAGTPVATLQPAPLSGSGFGSMKGQIKMSDDFDEPLEDFAEYM